MALIGYARVSTEDQATRRRRDELRAAGCQEILEEQASGGDRERPVLAQALVRLRPGDTLVFLSLDRLARSLSHLLEVIEGLQGRGLFFRSLRDPIDTASPRAVFTLEVLGAAARREQPWSASALGAGCAPPPHRGGGPATLASAPETLPRCSGSPRRGGRRT
jgi:DNA invertase Pin-like site-specific DNA recombinase